MQRATFQLGVRTSFRGCTPGKVDEVVQRDGSSKTKDIPAVYTLEMLDSDAEGLKAAADKWKRHYDRHEPEGALPRMVQVIKIEQIGPDPDPVEVQLGSAGIFGRIGEIIAEAIAHTLGAMKHQKN